MTRNTANHQQTGGAGARRCKDGETDISVREEDERVVWVGGREQQDAHGVSGVEIYFS